MTKVKQKLYIVDNVAMLFNVENQNKIAKLFCIQCIIR